jgi:hypothetical protein
MRFSGLGAVRVPGDVRPLYGLAHSDPGRAKTVFAVYSIASSAADASQR